MKYTKEIKFHPVGFVCASVKEGDRLVAYRQFSPFWPIITVAGMDRAADKAHEWADAFIEMAMWQETN